MAILDGIKNAVTANVARSANKVVVNGLRNIAGDIFGVNRSPTNSAAKLTSRNINRFTTENLAYPAGVEGDDQQGHYIIFEILEQQPAKLKKANAGTSSVATKKTISTEYGDIDEVGGGPPTAEQKARAEATRQKEQAEKKVKAGMGKTLSSGQSIQLSKNATTSMPVMIALYMPPSISVSYASNYGEQEIGALAGAAKGAIEAFRQGGDAQRTALTGALETAGKGLENAVMSTLDTVAPGTKALIALEKGAVITPRMELMFEGVGRRSFSYDFVFIPKDEAEAETVKKIVQRFKFHMASDFTDLSFREMKIPDMFNIKYMYKNAENTNLNKISTCVLESMDVNYGADRFVAYEGGVPQTTKISLKFKEMEIITKKQIGDGF